MYPRFKKSIIIAHAASDCACRPRHEGLNMNRLTVAAVFVKSRLDEDILAKSQAQL